MKFQRKQKHMIDFIFPVSLFFVFALCALTVLLLAARIYQSTTENSSFNNTARTGLSYISEKIHQNDTDGNIRIGSLEDEPALIMEQVYDEATYYTYIYSYEDTIRELFLKEGGTAEPSSGTKILEVEEFSMKQINENLFEFHCATTDGAKDSIVVAVRSN